jgi:hypothetical protein
MEGVARLRKPLELLMIEPRMVEKCGLNPRIAAAMRIAPVWA